MESFIGVGVVVGAPEVLPVLDPPVTVLTEAPVDPVPADCVVPVPAEVDAAPPGFVVVEPSTCAGDVAGVVTTVTTVELEPSDVLVAKT